MVPSTVGHSGSEFSDAHSHYLCKVRKKNIVDKISDNITGIRELHHQPKILDCSCRARCDVVGSPLSRRLIYTRSSNSANPDDHCHSSETLANPDDNHCHSSEINDGTR